MIPSLGATPSGSACTLVVYAAAIFWRYCVSLTGTTDGGTWLWPTWFFQGIHLKFNTRNSTRFTWFVYLIFSTYVSWYFRLILKYFLTYQTKAQTNTWKSYQWLGFRLDEEKKVWAQARFCRLSHNKKKLWSLTCQFWNRASVTVAYSIPSFNSVVNVWGL